MMEVNKILQGDVLGVLHGMPDDCIDTIVTSPPYWGLRDYGVKGQIGLEPTLEEYIKKLLAITTELQRVLKPTGVMFWNHGDCYSGGKTGRTDDYIYKDAQRRTQGRQRPPTDGIPTKCLALQNYRFILRMIDEQGWILRNIIQWHKPNSMPSSVKDRFSNTYEPVFMLVKQQKYWFDLDAVRKPHETEYKPFNIRKRGGKPVGFMASPQETRKTKIPKEQAESFGSPRARYHRNKTQDENYKKSGMRNAPEPGEPNAFNPAGKNPGDLWTIPTQPFPQAHFATFPEKLVEPMIKAACPEWICKKCGKARVRITENENPDRTLNKGRQGFRLDEIKKEKNKGASSAGFIQTKTLGWTKCRCKADWRPGITLDPFAGAGTTCVVAKKLGRSYLGIELSPDYIKIAEKRLLNTMGRLL